MAYSRLVLAQGRLFITLGNWEFFSFVRAECIRLCPGGDFPFLLLSTSLRPEPYPNSVISSIRSIEISSNALYNGCPINQRDLL